MHNGVSEDRDLCHRASTRSPGLLQGEERMSFKPNEKESALQLIEPYDTADTWPILSYKNVCHRKEHSLLLSLAILQNKTKFCLPAQAHMAPNGRSASPFWSCTSPRSPNDLSSCYHAIQVGPCYFGYLIYLGFLSLSSVLFLGWSGGSLAGCLVFCFHCVPQAIASTYPNGNRRGAVEVSLSHAPQDELGKAAAKEVLLVPCHRWGNQGWACK